MATLEENEKRKVNIKKVAKAAKNLGSFALYKSSEDSTLLLTRNFILNLNGEQAWEMQCALLIKELGKWYTAGKEGPIEGNPVKQSEVDLYYQTVKDEELNIIGFTELHLNNTALYAAESGYVGIKADYVDMLNGLSVMKQTKGKALIVASDFHVIAPVKEVQSEYLAPLLF